MPGRDMGRTLQEATLPGSVRYGVLSKERKHELFGLECADALEWRNWTPGTEYSKNYVVKNVSTETVRISYKQTASKAFSMDFPETIKLRPGMSHALKVVFRPLKLQQYSDHIEMFVNSASFIVLVEAYPPATLVEVPSQLDFGFIPTKERVARPLVIRNTGNTQVSLSWKLEEPFGITPTSATFGPGQSASFEVSFKPQEACSYDVHALCQLDNGISTTVKISGIGKFPYLSLEQPSIDFGSVLVGKTVERSFRFGNHSVVDANFTLAHSGGSEDGVFTVTPTKGTLGPDEYTLMTVTYTPKHTGTFSSENFSISTAGGNKVTLNLRGTALGPKVVLSATSFNFGNVPAGQTPSRVLYLQNQSDVPVVYDFQLDPEDTFSISKPRGVIPANSTGHVTITFRASSPANYWKRVAILIKDADPLGVDLLATYYDDKSRPPPFTSKHIVTYIERVTTGGAPVEIDPATISVPASPVPSNPTTRPGSATEHGDAATGAPAAGAVAAAGAVMTAGPGAAGLLGPGQTAANTAPLVGPDSWQLFFDGQDPSGAITVDASTLDFGTCSRLSASEYKTVTVTNNTSAKVTAFIAVPGWADPAGGPPKPVFQVFPESADIKPNCQASFRVAFRPPKDAQHYSQLLHVRAFVKSMRNFRLVPDALVVPPWSLPLLAVGNTFLHTNPEFAPKVELTHRAVAFPPCRPGEPAHQTVMIANYGDTPASFAFHTAGLAPHFRIKPEQGLVPPKGSVLVGLQFLTAEARAAAAQATCTFNGVGITAVPLTLSGSAHTPRLAFDVPGGALYFRPTCLGAVSQRSLVAHNPSRVPVAFEWRLPEKLRGVVSVAPASGLLRGNESTTLTWTFAPNAQKVLSHKVQCLLSDPDKPSKPAPAAVTAAAVGTEDGGAEETMAAAATAAAATATAAAGDVVSLTIVGEGTAGALAMDPPTLDLGLVPVGHAVQRVVSLLNQSDGVLRYRLECGPDPDADGAAEDGATPVEFPQQGLSAVEPRPGEEVWVDELEGAIPARASKEVTVTFFPRFRKPYRLQLRCRSSTVTPLAAVPPPLSAGPRPTSGSSPARGLLPPLSAGKRTGSGALPPLGNPPAVPGSHTTHTTHVALANGTAAVAAAADAWSAASAVCPITANTAFPGVLVTDAYLDGVTKPAVWDMLGVNTLNAELQKQVTELELDLNKMEVQGSLTTELAMAALAPFVLDFGVHAQLSRPVVIAVQLSSASDLAVHWEISSPDNLDLEMENWVEPGRPRNEQEKAVDFITEHRIFGVWPRAGVLQKAGQAQSVTLTYRPSHAGVHDLPVFLKLRNGKRLQLLLHGETVVEPPRRLLTCAAHRTLTFEPTPLGESAPPLHLQLLRSCGPGEAPYRLDLTQLAQLARDCWGFEVIKLCSETDGVVPEGGAAALNWQFTPLEAKHYSVDVPVLLANGSAELVTLQGRGYHPASPAAVSPLPGERARDWSSWRGFSSSPSAQPAGGRLASLCHDVLSLGTTLPQAVTRRIVVLSNNTQYPLTFDWDPCLFPAQPPHISGAASAIQAGLAISPRSGKLEAGERVVVRFALEAGVAPQLFEADVKCHVAVDEETMFERASEAVRQAEEAGPSFVDYTDTGSVIEEVIEESRDRRMRAAAASRVKAGARPRLPLHLYMTTAIRTRISKLDEQFSQTLHTLSQRQLAATQAPDIPEPQTIALALSGRILADSHVRAGTFIPKHELADAQLLLQGASWPPPPVDEAVGSGASPVSASDFPAVDPSLPGLAPAADSAVEAEADSAAEAAEAAGVVGGDDAEGAEGTGDVERNTEAGAVEESGKEAATQVAGEMAAAEGAGEQAAPSQQVERVSSQGAGGALESTVTGEAEAEPQQQAEAEEGAAAAEEGAAAAAEQQEEEEGAGAQAAEAFGSAWRPLPAPRPVDVPPQPPLNPEQEASRVALQVLQGMLSAALDPKQLGYVEGAWPKLKPERVPAFAELRQRLPLPFEAALGLASEPGVGEDVDGAAMGRREGGDGLDAVLADKGFQAFAEYVLESAVMGLVGESVAGEWEAV